jgi:enamine deaminase RidA (YjgF/YER057c/UK114 family)
VSERRFLNPRSLPDWSGSFSQVVIVPAGPVRSVHISGQVAVDPDRNVIGKGDLALQAERAFANLAQALAAADAEPAHVVRLGIYIVDYRPSRPRSSWRLCAGCSSTTACRPARGSACNRSRCPGS